MDALIGSGVLVSIIVVVLFEIGSGSGLIKSRGDWIAFGAAIVLLVALGVASHWLSGLYASESRTAWSVIIFAAMVMVVGLMLNIWIRVQHSTHVRKYWGVLSQREWNKRVDSVLAGLDSKKACK